MGETAETAKNTHIYPTRQPRPVRLAAAGIEAQTPICGNEEKP